MNRELAERYTNLVTEYNEWWGFEEGHTHEEGCDFYQSMTEGLFSILGEIEMPKRRVWNIHTMNGTPVTELFIGENMSPVKWTISHVEEPVEFYIEKEAKAAAFLVEGIAVEVAE